MKRILAATSLVATVIVLVLAQDQQGQLAAPQLGKSSVKEVLAVMNLDLTVIRLS
jgi:hypothetical protein